MDTEEKPRGISTFNKRPDGKPLTSMPIDKNDDENEQNDATKTRIRWPPLERSYHEKGYYKCKFPFLNKSLKDEALLRQILAHAPHRAKYGATQRRWEQVVKEANEAKDQAGFPIFGDKGIKLKGARDRFYAYITFMQKHNGRIPVERADDKEEYGEVLQLIQDMYEDYQKGKSNQRDSTQQKHAEDGSSVTESPVNAEVAVRNDIIDSGENPQVGKKSPAKPTAKRSHIFESLASLDQRLNRRDKRKAIKLEIKRRKYDLEQQRIDIERERLDLEKRRQATDEKDREVQRQFLMAVAKTLSKVDEISRHGEDIQEAMG